MAKESLKEMLLNVKPGDYSKIMEHTITKEDIKDFYELYYEFADQETKYHKMVLGRKEASKDFIEKLDLLKRMGELITRGIDIQKDYYEIASKDINRTYIEETQYSKIFEVIKRLASSDKKQYRIKTIKCPDYDTEERYGYRTSEEYTVEIIILAEKEALSKLESGKHIDKKEIEEIYHQGSSIILFGNDSNRTEKLDLPNQQIIGYYHPLVFYLQKDELAKAATSFISYIEENGVDLEQIETEELIEAIQTNYQKKENNSTTKKSNSINLSCFFLLIPSHITFYNIYYS